MNSPKRSNCRRALISKKINRIVSECESAKFDAWPKPEEPSGSTVVEDNQSDQARVKKISFVNFFTSDQSRNRPSL